jgi:predicted small secreted protein
MKNVIPLCCLLLSACNAAHGPDRDFKGARSLVGRAMEEHPDIVWLSIQAVPTGQTRAKVIACSEEEMVGKPADVESIEAMQAKQVAVGREGMYLYMTVPIQDKSGNAIAAMSITFKCQDSTSDEARVNQAKSIAREMSKEIQNAGRPMW